MLHRLDPKHLLYEDPAHIQQVAQASKQLVQHTSTAHTHKQTHRPPCCPCSNTSHMSLTACAPLPSPTCLHPCDWHTRSKQHTHINGQDLTYAASLLVQSQRSHQKMHCCRTQLHPYVYNQTAHACQIPRTNTRNGSGLSNSHACKPDPVAQYTTATSKYIHKCIARAGTRLAGSTCKHKAPPTGHLFNTPSHMRATSHQWMHHRRLPRHPLVLPTHTWRTARATLCP